MSTQVGFSGKKRMTKKSWKNGGWIFMKRGWIFKRKPDANWPI